MLQSKKITEMKIIFYISFVYIFFILSCNTAYKYEKLFAKGYEYKYRALYIDSIGDTITNEILIMKPLNRRWLGQPRIQESVMYIFITDTIGMKEFVSPDPTIRSLDEDYFKKHEKKRILKSEKTGAINNGAMYFLHPPRANQYYMLRYSAYPIIYYNKLNDSITNFDFSLREIMKYNHHYLVKPLKIKLENSSEKLWELEVDSKITNLSEYWKQYHIFDSKSKLIFSNERGFVKMHHTFENGIKIQFDLIEIARN